jgi:lipopolysaccharide/colanic/teichoic acid biosynthesis glycosyltransferase
MSRPRPYDRVKRAADACAALAGLVLSAPVAALVAAVVRVGLGSPVLFTQERTGRDGRSFVVYKFRTMRHAVGPDGQPLPDAARLSRLGDFLRRTSLDEIPQLWNVLKGDMSLVGPRPLLPEYLPLYTPEQGRRHEVRPGLTGWAAVNGRNAVVWEERFRMDVWYVDHRSLALDLRILLLTVRAVLGRRGTTQPGHATAEKFRGSAG